MHALICVRFQTVKISRTTIYGFYLARKLKANFFISPASGRFINLSSHVYEESSSSSSQFANLTQQVRQNFLKFSSDDQAGNDEDKKFSPTFRSIYTHGIIRKFRTTS